VNRVYVCGSFKFTRQMQELEARLQDEGIEFSASDRSDARGIGGCLEKIDEADIVYVVDPNGYVGKSVSIDIGYACGRSKPVYLMCETSDPPVMDLVEGVLSFEDLVSLVKHSHSSEKEKKP
jgi:hypothetical protein